MPITIATTRTPTVTILDLSGQYGISPNVPLQVKDVGAVQNMILNVLFTGVGEVPFEPQFGSGILKLLFDACSLRNGIAILNEAYFSIDTFMQGLASVNRAASSCTPNSDGGSYSFVLNYFIGDLPTTYTTSLTLNTSA